MTCFSYRSSSVPNAHSACCLWLLSERNGGRKGCATPILHWYPLQTHPELSQGTLGGFQVGFCGEVLTAAPCMELSSLLVNFPLYPWEMPLASTEADAELTPKYKEEFYNTQLFSPSLSSSKGGTCRGLQQQHSGLCQCL